jgi:hydroxymethylbilane synthase
VLRLGTRRSKLALAQAAEVARLLEAGGAQVETVPIVTSGDRGVTDPTTPAGMKGLFVHEIVRALQAGRIDLAVHSAKDLPADDPPGVVVGATPERASAFDVLVCRAAALPEPARVGTSSIRRRAQIAAVLPGAVVQEVRGNVDTRLRRLHDGEVDALVLAKAGLDRLGISLDHCRLLGPEEMVPAPGQGALAVQVREDDAATGSLVKRISHPPTRVAVDAERGLMALMGGGCDLPVGAYAEATDDGVRLVAAVIAPDGSRIVRAEQTGASASWVAGAVAASLRAGGATEILAAVGRGS